MIVFALMGALLPAVGNAPVCSFGWLPTEGLPGVDGAISSLTVWDPDGPGPEPALLVVGGGIRIAGDVGADGIAVWDGTNWQAFSAGVTGDTLAVYDGDLVATGPRVRIDGVVTATVQRWNGSRWETLGAGFTGGGTASPRVDVLTTYGGDLIAGGSFTHADGTIVNNIARWDGSKWRPLGTGVTNGSRFVSVDALAVFEGDLIAGGYFDAAGGSAAMAIARWDGTTWYDMGGGMDNGSHAPSVSALMVTHSGLFAGGYFSRAGSIGAANIARWDGRQWQAVGGGVSGWVYALAVFEDNVVAAGAFRSAGAVPAGHIARWDGKAWYPLGDGISDEWDPLGGCQPSLISPYVYTLAVYQNELIAGGGFKFAGAGAARHIARWNGNEWSAIGTGMSISPGALLVHEGRLIAGGGFMTLSAEGDARNIVAAWDGQRWDVLSDEIAGQIHALASFRGDIIAAGQFSVAGQDMESWYIARWDGSQWRPLRTGISQSSSCPLWVAALIDFGGDLCLGGAFAGIGDTDARGIARWDGQAWHALGSGINGTAHAMTVYDQWLVVGGDFTEAGGVARKGIAAWDGSSWAPLGTGLDGIVSALTVFDGRLLALYSPPGEFPSTNVAVWDGVTWTLAGEGMDNYVSGLVAYNGDLFAIGDFASAGGTPADGIARWDGIRWQAVPGGLVLWGSALAVYRGELIAAGSAYLSDGRVSANWSRWGPTRARADFDNDGNVDLSDYVELRACLSGPAAASSRAIAANECLCVLNSDGDGDIDLGDVARFQAAFGSAGFN